MIEEIGQETMEITVSNVSGDYNNCFFNAATAALGMAIMSEVFHIPATQLTSRALRKSVTRLYDTDAFRTMYETIYDEVAAGLRHGLSAAEIEQELTDVFDIEPSVFKCVYAVAKKKGVFDDAIYASIRKCAKDAFVDKCPMVGQHEMTAITDYLADGEGIHLVVLSIDDALHRRRGSR